MTAYIPGYEYEVFVIYARRGNLDKMSDNHCGRVTRFQQNLKSILDARCRGTRLHCEDVSIT